MLAELVIPNSQLQVGFWLLVSYIVAAIGWGIRVEMRMAALSRDSEGMREEQGRMQRDLHEEMERNRRTADAVIRIDENLRQLNEASRQILERLK